MSIHTQSHPITAEYDIVPLNGKTMDQWYAEQTRKPTTMINASLYVSNYKNPIGTIKYDGKWVVDSGYGFGFGTKSDNSAAFGGPWDLTWVDFITGYPPLIKDGVFSTDYFGGVTKDVINASTRRSAIGLKGTNIVFASTSSNFTLKGFAEKLLGLGWTQAINLDGGGSARLKVNGKDVNSPTDNRRITNCIVCYTGGTSTTPPSNPTTDKEGMYMKIKCKIKTTTKDSAGNNETGRYIAVGDVCTINRMITENMLIEVEYPVGSSTRIAYIRNLNNFAKA